MLELKVVDEDAEVLLLELKRFTQRISSNLLSRTQD
jgi:hypothetical protein